MQIPYVQTLIYKSRRTESRFKEAKKERKRRGAGWMKRKNRSDATLRSKKRRLMRKTQTFRTQSA